MITKTERQSQCIDKIVLNDYTGIIHLCTRFGKTRIGLLVANGFKITNGGQVLILVQSQTIKKVWESEILVLGLELEHFVIITANQALNTNRALHTNYLIVDECHKFISPEWYNLINDTKIHYDHILLMTGTLPKDSSLLTKLAPIVDYIGDEEAIANNWVSNYVEYNIKLDLPIIDQQRYVELTHIIRDTFDKYKNLFKCIVYQDQLIFKDDLDLIMSVIDGKYSKQFGFISAEQIREAIITKMIKQDGIWTQDVIREECKLTNNAIYKRNRILTDHKLKVLLTNYIHTKLQLNTICFSETTNMADSIGLDINNAFVYHSKTLSATLIDPTTNDFYKYVSGTKIGQPKIFSKTKQLEYMIEAMRHGMINFISTVKSLDEGITIPDCNCIITTAGSTNPITYDQRTGRGKTFVDENKLTRIYNLYFDDFTFNEVLYKSRDKVKLALRQASSKDVIEININDI
jgi:superfamily II DNA or RNA helicase